MHFRDAIQLLSYKWLYSFGQLEYKLYSQMMSVQSKQHQWGRRDLQTSTMRVTASNRFYVIRLFVLN